MSQTRPSPSTDSSYRRTLAKYADVLEATADEVDDQHEADVYRVLAAIGRGETPPQPAAIRIYDRATTEGA